MKKSFEILTTVCVLGLLAGCGSGNSAPPPPSIVTTQPQLTAAPAIAGTSYSFPFHATGMGTLTWSAVGLPSNNFSLDPATGIVSGTPASKGNVIFTLTVIDTSDRSSPATQFTITVSNPPPPSITTTQSQLTAASPEVGNFYSFSFTASGGLAPLTWTEHGTLPSSLALSTDGVLSGTATATGTFVITVTAQDVSAQKSGPQNFTLTVINPPPPVINTSPSPTVGMLNQPYSFTFTATGGLAPLSWTQSGALPTGLLFSTGGVISGTPTVTGSFPISVVVQDSLGQNAGPQSFTINVTATRFKSAGSMETPRYLHTATLLSDGKVIIAGGNNGVTSLAAADLFDPGSGRFAATGNMSTPRDSHTATLLSNGLVLIAGGQDGNGNVLMSAELYDPLTGSFTPTGNMTMQRKNHTATVLTDGKVLVTGGLDGGRAISTAELFDPSTRSFTATGSMGTPREEHAAVRLTNGKVLVAGGYGTGGATAEQFDPSTGSFTPTGNMTAPLSSHTATLLSDGRVLVVGGNTANLFDPTTETFTATGGPTTWRISHAATLLNDGTVLLTGGEHFFYGGAYAFCNGPHPQATATAELYAPKSGTFIVTGNMATERASHTATLLTNGELLVIGGIRWTYVLQSDNCFKQSTFFSASAERFQ